MCDTEKGVYPMTCTFHQHLNDTSGLGDDLRNLSSVASDVLIITMNILNQLGSTVSSLVIEKGKLA